MVLVATLLFAIPVSAVTRARESNLHGGWQIWIEASDFDDRDDVVQLGVESDQKFQDKVAAPVLGKDFVIAPVQGGWMSYNFESAVAGEAHGYFRVFDFRGGNQSWHVLLNTEDVNNGMIVDTGFKWVWNSGKDAGPSNFPTDLEEGANTVRIVPRETGAGVEIMFDIICVSSVSLDGMPTDDDWLAARPLGGEAVDSVGKLTTTWGTIKNRF